MSRRFKCSVCGKEGHSKVTCADAAERPSYAALTKYPDNVIKQALLDGNGRLQQTGKILGCSRERVRQLVQSRGLADFAASIKAATPRQRKPRRAPDVIRANHRAVAAERRKHGRCGKCGRMPAHGKKTCELCQTRWNNYARDRYKKRALANECVRCKAPVVDRRYCEECIRRLRSYRRLTESQTAKPAKPVRRSQVLAFVNGRARTMSMEVSMEFYGGRRHRQNAVQHLKALVKKGLIMKLDRVTWGPIDSAKQPLQ